LSGNDLKVAKFLSTEGNHLPWESRLRDIVPEVVPQGVICADVEMQPQTPEICARSPPTLPPELNLISPLLNSGLEFSDHKASVFAPMSQEDFSMPTEVPLLSDDGFSKPTDCMVQQANSVVYYHLFQVFPVSPQRLGVPPLPQTLTSSDVSEVAARHARAQTRAQNGIQHTAWRAADGTWLHRISWFVPVRKFTTTDRQIISPSFSFGLSEQDPEVMFVMMLHPTRRFLAKGGGSLKKAKGSGELTVKCNSDILADSANLIFRVTVGKETFGPVQHNFAQHPVGHLPKKSNNSEEWNFLKDNESEKFIVTLEVEKLPSGTDRQDIWDSFQ